MCPRGRPRCQGHPRGLHLWFLEIATSLLICNICKTLNNSLEKRGQLVLKRHRDIHARQVYDLKDKPRLPVNYGT